MKLNPGKSFETPEIMMSEKNRPIRQLTLPFWTWGEEQYKYAEMEFSQAIDKVSCLNNP